MANREAKVRSKMAKSVSGLTGRTGKWFGSHPDALEEVKIWMQMARDGETEWSLTRLHKELLSEHNFPFTAVTYFGSFMRSNFPDEYPWMSPTCRVRRTES